MTRALSKLSNFWLSSGQTPMDPKKFKAGKKPETILQDQIVKELRNLGWYCQEMHGNLYQNGVPDIYACHPVYGPRWIEVKIKDKYSFTPAQLEKFPLMQAHGAKIWILVGSDKQELDKLFQPANWEKYKLALAFKAR